MRAADYFVVFTNRDQEIAIKDGVPAEKIYVLPHPLQQEVRKFFEKTYFSNSAKEKKDNKILTLMLPDNKIGFRKTDLSLIKKEEMQKRRVEIVSSINQILREWKIFIKPHPETENIEETKEVFESISNNIEVVNPSEPADKFIEISDVIIGIPPASTAIFTASLQRPEKIILSLDLNQELLGDTFKNFDEVDYIDIEEKFFNTLKLIRDNKYPKRLKKELNLGQKEFSNTIEMLESLYENQQIKK